MSHILDPAAGVYSEVSLFIGPESNICAIVKRVADELRQIIAAFVVVIRFIV